MGLNFRRTLISELERRQSEIDSTLSLLRRLRGFDPRYTQAAGEKPGTVRSHPARYEEIQELRQQGFSLRAIAEQVRLSHAGVWKALRRIEREQSGSAQLGGEGEQIHYSAEVS